MIFNDPIEKTVMWLTQKDGAACYRIELVLFDFDGTLTEPEAIDFTAIKRLIGCPPDSAILEFIASLPDAASQQRALGILNTCEMGAAENVKPNDGAEEIVRFLKAQRVKLGIITRNGMGPVRRALQNFSHLTAADFDVIISREDPVKPKPSEEGVLLALQRVGVAPGAALLVGDYRFDMQAGNAAGLITVLLKNPGPKKYPVEWGADSAPIEWGADYVIERLPSLMEMLQPLLPQANGKLPNRFLKQFLTDLERRDPALLIPAAVGEDTAAVNISGEEVLVLKSDPITLVTDLLGSYALIVNGNDIATSGAIPRWFLATFLFPSGSTPAEVMRMMVELRDQCQRAGITLCGGHTEVTDAVRRPIVIGTITGTVSRSRLLDKKNVRPGDRILLTKRVAVEGTAIIAAEFGERLVAAGMSMTEIEDCRRFQERMSIVPEANVAIGFPEVCAMHDVTEGGLATALTELAEACGRQLRIDIDAIPVYSETRRICDWLGLEPLGLIGSGSLIICCRSGGATRLAASLAAEKIEVTSIGEVVDGNNGIDARSGNTPVPWPAFETDEIGRLFGSGTN
jgi:hydrogenase expression/formation protein HypE